MVIVITACVELTNKTFGRLTVIQRVENNKYGRSQWLCQCNCGNQTVVLGASLQNGRTISCGCYRSEKVSNMKRKHGATNTRLYRIWKAMKNRCYNPDNCQWVTRSFNTIKRNQNYWANVGESN